MAAPGARGATLRLLAFGVVCFLFLPASADFASPGSTPGAAPTGQGHSALLPQGPHAKWSAATGRPSPGTPHYRLSTVSLLSSGCVADYERAWLAYDPGDRSFWVAAPNGCVVVVPAGQPENVSASYPVGTDPFGVAIDNATGDVFVTNTGSGNVTVLNGTDGAAVASIGVGVHPMGIAYDSAAHQFFIANNGSNNVSVISGRTFKVVATVPVGSDPVGVAFDPANGKVFVADRGSDNVTVISASTDHTVGSVAVGVGPYGVAIDNATDQVYVTNELSDNVSVVNATSDAVVASIGVTMSGIDLQGIAYDTDLREMWAGGGLAYAIVLNTTTQTVGWYVTTDPSGVAYDPASGLVCMTNTANFTFSCAYFPEGFPTVPATFLETGLPAGRSWSVGISTNNSPEVNFTTNSTFVSIGLTAVFPGYPNSTTYNFTVYPPSGFEATPSSGILVVYSTRSGPVEVNLTFGPANGTYLLMFNEYGLPADTAWGVNLSGTTKLTMSWSLWFLEPNGSYSFRVTDVQGYEASPSIGTVVVNGTSIQRTIAFTASPPPTTYPVSFFESGLPSWTEWSIVVDTSNYSSNSSVISIDLTSGNYNATVPATDNFTGEPATFLFEVVNASLSFGIHYTASYALTFAESGLPTGTTWSVAVDGQISWSTGTTIAFRLGEGNYTFSVGGGPGFDPSRNGSGTLFLTADRTVLVVFSTSNMSPPARLYLVTVQEIELPSGAIWGITMDGVSYSTSGPDLFVPLANGSHDLVPHPYAGFAEAPADQAFWVAGGPVTLTVTFVPVSGSASTSGLTLFEDAAVLAAVGVSAAAVGVQVGLLAAGRRRTPPSP